MEDKLYQLNIEKTELEIEKLREEILALRIRNVQMQSLPELIRLLLEEIQKKKGTDHEEDM